MAMSAGVARKASCGPGFARSSITDGAPPPVVWQVDGDLDGALCLLWRGFGWRLVDAEQFRAAFHEAHHSVYSAKLRAYGLHFLGNWVVRLVRFRRPLPQRVEQSVYALHFECAQLVGVACDLLGRC